MKPKKIKTLSLNKETIADLKTETMRVVNGGTGYSVCICSLDLCTEHTTCQVTPECTQKTRCTCPQTECC
jgi:hypothetical protein